MNKFITILQFFFLKYLTDSDYGNSRNLRYSEKLYRNVFYRKIAAFYRELAG